MCHCFEMTARHDAFFQVAHDTFADLLNLLATCANQMMPVRIAAFGYECESRRAIAEKELLHHAQFFKQLYGTIHRRKIASALRQKLEDFLVRQRAGFLFQHTQDFPPRTSQLFGFPPKSRVQATRLGLTPVIGCNRLHISMRKQEHATDAESSSKKDRRQLGKVEPMHITRLKQDRRGDVHENADDECHEFACVIGKSRVLGNKHSKRRHGSEQNNDSQSAPAFHAGLKQHAEQRDGDGVIMDDNADQKHPPRSALMTFVSMTPSAAQCQSFNEGVQAKSDDDSQGHFAR